MTEQDTAKRDIPDIRDGRTEPLTVDEIKRIRRLVVPSVHMADLPDQIANLTSAAIFKVRKHDDIPMRDCMLLAADMLMTLATQLIGIAMYGGNKIDLEHDEPQRDDSEGDP